MAKIIIEKIHPDLPDPAYALPGDAGVDVYSAVDTTIPPRGRTLIPLGVKLQLPRGKAALILPKSGLATKYGLTCTTGLIDSGYRGEISMQAVNLSDDPIEIDRGQKVCQLVFIDAPRHIIHNGKVVNDTVRGELGFGSTGINKPAPGNFNLIITGKDKVRRKNNH